MCFRFRRIRRYARKSAPLSDWRKCEVRAQTRVDPRSTRASHPSRIITSPKASDRVNCTYRLQRTHSPATPRSGLAREKAQKQTDQSPISTRNTQYHRIIAYSIPFRNTHPSYLRNAHHAFTAPVLLPGHRDPQCEMETRARPRGRRPPAHLSRRPRRQGLGRYYLRPRHCEATGHHPPYLPRE